MAQPSETSSAFEIKFTSREVSAWGGLALMKRMLDSMNFRTAASQWDLPWEERMGLICGNCKYERPSNHRGADTSCPLCNTAYPAGLAAPAIGGAPPPKATHSQRKKRTIAVVILAVSLVIAIAIGKPYYNNYQYDHLPGFDRRDRVTAAEDMVRTFYSDKGASVVEVTLIKESTRKMKGYAILGDRYHAEHQNQRNCTVEFDADMEKLLLTCEVSR